MKQLGETSINLIRRLNDGELHSGQHLADELGITRNAVWKQIGILKGYGLIIESYRQKGYRLVDTFIPLDLKTLKTYIKTPLLQKNISWYLFSEIFSTNAFLKTKLINESEWLVCLSESQSKGRGRFQRNWHSPFGKNIYCSVQWIFRGDVTELAGLSLVMGLAILKGLIAYGLNRDYLSIKWPNDIYYKGKKIAGILIELSAESHFETHVVIGVGLNVNMHEADIESSWTSLYLETEIEHDRHPIIISVLTQIFIYLNDYNKDSRERHLSEWSKYDHLFGLNVKVKQYNQVINGVAQGVNEVGDLIVRENSGLIRWCASGEATLLKE
jgi:BirA family biotin operon repressor/biotin-[acetyl-CoA-carboxylase] ligase